MRLNPLLRTIIISRHKMKKQELFDKYIQNGTPEQKECAQNWSIAIGLQAVDGLQVSDYLIELAEKNIKGELTSDEVSELLNEHYAPSKEYNTYTQIDCVPDIIEAKRGRPI